MVASVSKPGPSGEIITQWLAAVHRTVLWQLSIADDWKLAYDAQRAADKAKGEVQGVSMLSSRGGVFQLPLASLHRRPHDVHLVRQDQNCSSSSLGQRVMAEDTNEQMGCATLLPVCEWRCAGLMGNSSLQL